jgi:preprotein translocase subunit SecG
MGFLIGILTVVMVLDCIVLMFLVLIQLPKKEAGAGLAFGGAATDALFGAGSGNVLTKITKYSAGVFFVLAIILSLLQRNYHNRTTSAFAAGLTNAPAIAPAMPATAPAAPSTAPQTPATQPAAVPAATNGGLRIVPQVEDTNISIPLPATSGTSAPATK